MKRQSPEVLDLATTAGVLGMTETEMDVLLFLSYFFFFLLLFLCIKDFFPNNMAYQGRERQVSLGNQQEGS